MPWGDFLRLIFIHSIIIIIKIIIDSNTAVITEFHSALPLIIKCQFIPCCVTCFVNLCSRDIKSALLRAGVSSLPFYLFIFQNNSRGAFCGVKSRCMAASISRRRRPADKLELCSIWPQPMQRKQAPPPPSIMLVTSSPGASFKGRGGGGLRVTGSEGRTPPRPLFEARLLIISLIPAPPRRLLFAKNEGTRRKDFSAGTRRSKTRVWKGRRHRRLWFHGIAHAGFENTHTRTAFKCRAIRPRVTPPSPGGSGEGSTEKAEKRSTGL